MNNEQEKKAEEFNNILDNCLNAGSEFLAALKTKTMNNQQKAEEYAEQILADKLQHQLYCNAEETVLLHDALTNAVLYGIALGNYAVKENLWEGMIPFLDEDEKLAWKHKADTANHIFTKSDMRRAWYEGAALEETSYGPTFDQWLADKYRYREDEKSKPIKDDWNPSIQPEKPKK